MKTRYIAPIMMLALGFTAQAQALQGEVSVDRTVNPAVRPATRLGSVSPAPVSPQISHMALEAAPYNGTGTLSRSLTRLEPAAYADTLATEPWLGYVSAGYFPAQSFSIQAGYDLLSSRTTRLGAFLDFAGTSYDKNFKISTDDISRTIGHQHYTIGARTAAFAGKDRRIDGEFAYTLANTRMPMAGTDLKGGYHHARLAAVYNSLGGTFPWHAGLRYSYLGMRHDTDPSSVCGDTYRNFLPDETRQLKDISPVHESVISLDGGVTWRNDKFWWDLGLRADIQSLSALARVWPASLQVPEATGQPSDSWQVQPMYWDEGSHTLSLISLNPAYNLQKDKWAVRLGAKVQYTTGPRENKFRIAPDVSFDWTPSGRIAVGVTLTGGERLNTLESLNAASPWLIPCFSYERSNLPLALDASANFGPFAGISIRPFVGYAIADSWLMPGVVVPYGIPQYNYQDVHGAHYGVEISYESRLISARASIEGASAADDDAESAYYLWSDRAKFEARLAVEVRPIKPLTVGLGYTARTDRKVYRLQSNCFGPISWFESNDIYDLGDISNLSLNATWRFSDQLSIFANFDNLLCQRYDLIYGVPSARLAGLFGATYKF